MVYVTSKIQGGSLMEGAWDTIGFRPVHKIHKLF